MQKTTCLLSIILYLCIVVFSPGLTISVAPDGLENGIPLSSSDSQIINANQLPSSSQSEIGVELASETVGADPPNGITTDYDWWNTSWHYRILLSVNASSLSRFNVTVPTYINMTDWLASADISESVDENSTRVVEHDIVTGDVIVEQPSVFFKAPNWDATINATGWLLFFINGSMAPNTNRTFFVYFDTIQKGTKVPAIYPEIVHGWFSQYYGYDGGHFSMPSESMYGWKNLDTTTNQIAYKDGSENNFPTGADGSSPNWDQFSANYTTWLYVPEGGTYGFQTSSDDGSWLYVDDQLIVNNGGGHGLRTISNTATLSTGLHTIWVPWYENTGGAGIYVRWKPPGAGSYTYLTGADVTTIKFGTLMDMTTPVLFTWGDTMGIFLLRVHVVDADNTEIVDTPVRLINATNPSEVFATKLTDGNGNCSFNVIAAGEYSIIANYTTAYPTGAPEKITMNTTWTFELNSTVEGELLDRTLIIDVATLTYTVYDLDNQLMATTATESTVIYIFNTTYTYLAYQSTDINGQVTFSRLPIGDYSISSSYTDSFYSRVYSEAIMPDNDTTISVGFSHRMIIPLCDMNVWVVAYGTNDVPDVSFDLTSVSYSSVFHTYSAVTDSNGEFLFNRLLNGTWNIRSYRNDAYAQLTENTTQVTIQSGTYPAGTPFQFNFPLNNLEIHVQETVSGEKLSGANVTVWEFGAYTTLIAQGATDGNGDIKFTWLKNTTYWVNASILGSYAMTSDQIGIDLHEIKPMDGVTQTIRITISFAPEDCVFLLDLNNATIIYSYYNSNFTIRFQFVNKTGGPSIPDIPIDDIIAQWIRFNITHSGFTTIYGEWDPPTIDSIWYDGSGYWYITINTTQFFMVASAEPYIVTIDGDALNGTTQFNKPEPLLISIYVQITPTSLTKTPSGDITITWADLIHFNVTYLDIMHLSLPIDGASTGVIISGTYSWVGSLVGIGDGKYQFYHYAVPGDLNLPPGTYTMTLTVQINNYQAKILILTLIINEVSTVGQVLPATVLLSWSNGFTINVSYTFASNGSAIIGATVSVDWAGTPVLLTYNPSTQQYEGTFVGSTWALGSHTNVAVVASLGNHTTQNLQFDVTIIPAPTGGTSPPDFPIQEWGQFRSFSFTFTDLNTTTYIHSADITLNWTMGYWSVVDLGNGTYTLSIDMSITPGTYPVKLTASKYGYEPFLQSFYVVLLIPLQIESTLPTGWVTVQWTDSFNLDVLVRNGFSLANETGVDVQWSWDTNNGAFSWAANVYSTLTPIDASMFGAPGEYILTLSASKYLATNTTGIIYVTVVANPTTITKDLVGNLQIYYAENETILFQWTDTYESLGIGDADSINASVYLGTTYVGTPILIDYGNGTYAVIITSTTMSMIADESYILYFIIDKVGYLQGSTSPIVINCLARPTTLALSLYPSQVMAGDTPVHIIVVFTDTRSGTSIGGATVTLDITSLGTFTMTYQATYGRYFFELDTTSLSIGAYQVQVSGALANYIAGLDTDVLQVIEKGFQIGPIRVTLSQLFFAAAGIAIVIVAFAGYVGYKRATVPYQVKALNKAIKAINKGKPAALHPSLMSRDDLIKKSLRRYYRRIGVDLEEGKEAG